MVPSAPKGLFLEAHCLVAFLSEECHCRRGPAHLCHSPGFWALLLTPVVYSCSGHCGPEPRGHRVRPNLVLYLHPSSWRQVWPACCLHVALCPKTLPPVSNISEDPVCHNGGPFQGYLELLVHSRVQGINGEGLHGDGERMFFYHTHRARKKERDREALWAVTLP